MDLDRRPDSEKETRAATPPPGCGVPMTAPPLDGRAQRRSGVPRPRLGELELVVRRLRFAVITLAIAIVAVFGFLGAQIWLTDARIGQLTTKVNGIDASFGVKFEETGAKLDAANTRLDAISQRLPAEFKTIRDEIAAQSTAVAKSIASLRGLAPSPPTSLLPEPAPGPKSPPAKARP
jgi:hypothetical protein